MLLILSEIEARRLGKEDGTRPGQAPRLSRLYLNEFLRIAMAIATTVSMLHSLVFLMDRQVVIGVSAMVYAGLNMWKAHEVQRFGDRWAKFLGFSYLSASILFVGAMLLCTREVLVYRGGYVLICTGILISWNAALNLFYVNPTWKDESHPTTAYRIHCFICACEFVAGILLADGGLILAWPENEMKMFNFAEIKLSTAFACFLIAQLAGIVHLFRVMEFEVHHAINHHDDDLGNRRVRRASSGRASHRQLEIDDGIGKTARNKQNLKIKIKLMDVTMYVLGGIFFLVGSVLFFPRFKAQVGTGALLFIIGSVCYVLGSIDELSLFFRVDEDSKSLKLAALCYFFGSLTFVLGSVFVHPQVEMTYYGAVMFVIGSLLFVIGPFCVICHGPDDWLKTRFSRQAIIRGKAIELQYVVGSVLFTAGSFVYLDQTMEVPAFQDAAWEFVIGSIFFSTGALTSAYDLYLAVKQQGDTNSTWENSNLALAANHFQQQNEVSI